MKNVFLFSPLIGSFLFSIFIGIYNIIISPDINSAIIGLIKFFPTIFVVVSLFSYLISTPINFFLFKKHNEFLWSDIYFLFLATLLYIFIIFVVAIFFVFSFGFNIKYLYYSFFALFSLYFNSSLFLSIYKYQNSKEI